MDVFRSDVRDALRQLRRQPVFTLTAAFSLALGIGAPATIFALANAFLLRPLPVANQERLRYVYATSPDGSSFHSFSYPMYRALRDQNRSLAGLAAFDVAPLSVSTGGDASLAFGVVASWNYFRVLGVTPARGRFFLPEEDATPLSHPVAVASYTFWQERLNGDPGAVGRTISVNGHPFTLVGVTPAGFRGTVPLMRPDLWTPIMMGSVTSPGMRLDSFGYNTFQLFARLPDGAADASTERTLDRLAKRIVEENPGAPTGQGVDMHPLTALPTEATRGVALFMAMLLTFSVLILLVAGGNVASMLLARAIRRRRELAIRIAIGASRVRLVRQLVTETLALFLLGAAGAVFVAWSASRAMSAFDPHLGIPLQLDFPIDARVIVFTVVAAILAGLALGLVPALQGTRGNLTPDLKEGSSGTSTRSRTWNVLVGAQVAFTVLLLAGAGLMTRALQRAATVDVGLDAHSVYLASTDLRMRDYNAVNGRDALRRWGEAVAAQPGVSGVAFARRPALGLGNTTTVFRIDRREVPAGADSTLNADVNSVSPEYFDVMHVPIVAGRAFGSQDIEGSPPVAIVSEAFARRWFSSATAAVDRALRFTGDSTPTRIVGVAANTTVRAIAEEPRPYLYRPIAQSGVNEMTLLARTTGPDPLIGEKIRSALRAIDPGLPLMNAMTYENHIGIALIPQRVAGVISASLGLAGLLLAATGIYGIVAYAVSQRTREIGVRVAIGASPHSVVRLMARHGMRLAAIGLATGLLVAAAASRLMTPFLLGVSPGDPVTFGAIVVVVAGVTALACLIPARRASLVDPVVALRAE